MILVLTWVSETLALDVVATVRGSFMVRALLRAYVDVNEKVYFVDSADAS